MKSMRCLPIGNKGFISVYTLIVLQIVLMAISLFSLRITTLQNAAMADSPIDLYILQSIKSQLAKQETDENIVEGEELTEEESRHIGRRYIMEKRLSLADRKMKSRFAINTIRLSVC